METINLVKETLMSFFEEMHEWENNSQNADLDKSLSVDERFQKKKEGVSLIFQKYCTDKDRKEGRPNVIHHGSKDTFEYDSKEEEITEAVQEGATKVVIYTQRKKPMPQRFQYIFRRKGDQWLLDTKKKANFENTKWLNRSI